MTVVEILKQAGECEDHVLREHATLLALSKMSRYEAECALFEEKYAEPFHAFKERVRSMLNEEDFQMDDDLMDWEFAHTALSWWKDKLEEIRHVG
ncbi:hypothetical protein SAMN06295888_10518 [Desulfonatronum zhilinae]|nr:hypothetical protein SAMN06295888_10518 [Desulfonatronum zhilinae]